MVNGGCGGGLGITKVSGLFLWVIPRFSHIKTAEVQSTSAGCSFSKRRSIRKGQLLGEPRMDRLDDTCGVRIVHEHMTGVYGDIVCS